MLFVSPHLHGACLSQLIVPLPDDPDCTHWSVRVTYSLLVILHRRLVTIASIAISLLICLSVYLLVQSCYGVLPVLTPRYVTSYDPHQLHSVCRLKAIRLSLQHSLLSSLAFVLQSSIFSYLNFILHASFPKSLHS